MTSLLEIIKDYDEITGVHPAAELFPPLQGKDFEALCTDIAARGMAHPLVLTPTGLLLDGCNRLRACSATMTEVTFTTYHGDDVFAHAMSLNMQRRQLTASQRAIIAAKYAVELQKVEPRGNRHTGGRGRAREEAAEQLNVGSAYVARAQKVLQDEELTAKVAAGELPLTAAYTQVQATEKAQQPPSDKPVETLTLYTDKGEEVPYPKPQAKSTFNEQKDLEIGWAMYSWNPVTGCRHTCSYCYARSLAEAVGMKRTYPVGFTPLFHHERLDAPHNTKVPAKAAENPAFGRVFVCSMADLFGSWVPQEWIDQVVASTVANPQWEYLFLTKYPQRYDRLNLPSSGWMGASIDSQRVVEPTLEALRAIKGVKHKWLSMEPLLEPIDISSFEGIDWVVIGAQSANKGQNEAFAPQFDWVMDLVIKARRDGAKVWLKHNLLGAVNENLPGMVMPNELP